MRFAQVSRPTVAVVFAAIAGAIVGGLLLASPLAQWQGTSNESAPASSELAVFPFETADGRKLTLKAFSDKAVLLNLWATWCPPCRKEMPSLDRLQSLKGGTDFEVVALSIDKGGTEQVQPFFEEIGIKRLEMYLDQPGVSMQALKIVGLPTTLLVGKDGRELARWVGPKEWDDPETVKEIEALLARSEGD
ncbi:TlpA family protein disulfide reductase [Manganibacter manganicus]|nr:TlpA disulfide reductase family protein [Pseudaminobacter manganicus]